MWGSRKLFSCLQSWQGGRLSNQSLQGKLQQKLLYIEIAVSFGAPFFACKFTIKRLINVVLVLYLFSIPKGIRPKKQKGTQQCLFAKLIIV
jgi:hypothetical protein